MGFRGGPHAFALALGLRALLVSALGFLAAWLVFERGFYFNALIVAGVIALVIADIVRQLTSADRFLSRFVDGLVVEGDERPAPRLTGMPVLDEAVAGALDRLGRSRSERQMRIDYLQTLADTVSAALLVIDEEGRIELANQSARRLLPAAKRLADLGEALAARLADARPGVGEVVRLADGRAMFALVTGFSTPRGGARRLVSLQRVAGDLDAVELRAWEDLVKVLSHEIMNSLTPILSLAQSGQVLIGKDDREAAEALAIIARRSEGLMTFVERYRQVFDIPKPEPRRVALGEVVSRLERLLTSQAREAKVAFTWRCETPKVELMADAALLDQAIINLAKNAIEAVRGRDDGAVFLTARLEVEAVAIEVSDNGPGLSPEDVETAFVPFFTRKPGGSGVGLSVARRIAIAHGGAVEYLPGKDGGAVFRLSLPLA